MLSGSNSSPPSKPYKRLAKNLKAEDLYRDYLSNNSGKKIGKKAFLNFMKTQGHVYTRIYISY